MTAGRFFGFLAATVLLCSVVAAIPMEMALYSTHLLVSSYPEERLPTEAKALRDEHLALAKPLSEPREVTVTAWRAKYHESDPRIMLFDPKGHVLEGQETMKIRIWPYVYSDGERMASGRRIPDRTKELFDSIERVIAAIYPEEEP